MPKKFDKIIVQSQLELVHNMYFVYPFKIAQYNSKKSYIWV